jgi:hypothetical protein
VCHLHNNSTTLVCIGRVEERKDEKEERRGKKKEEGEP